MAEAFFKPCWFGRAGFGHFTRVHTAALKWHPALMPGAPADRAFPALQGMRMTRKTKPDLAGIDAVSAVRLAMLEKRGIRRRSCPNRAFR